ncbi:hypothetical protein XENORESO_003519 [Xenotaenia resolanae]|uniref:Uncharacterized protein n=1 Tax=Xenotaenia resolanae TaxID=208358 RepID=A0ABV0WXS4_9TELE
MSSCLIMCWWPFCCLNSPGLLKHSLPLEPLGAAVISGTKMLAAYSLKSCNFYIQHIPQRLSWIETSRIWRPSQHLKLIFGLLKDFLNHFYFVAGYILTEEGAAIRNTISVAEYTLSGTMLV